MKVESVYEATGEYAHNITDNQFRNVRGKVPHYREVFLDKGDIDMVRVLRILKEKKLYGVLIPDHTPPWHAGMAYTLGYMKSALSLI